MKYALRSFGRSILKMLGRPPLSNAQQTDKTDAAKKMHAEQATKEATEKRRKLIKAEKATYKPATKWRNRRWAVIIILNAIFIISYSFDIQVVEGSLSASRVLGFHLIDLNSALQVMLAHKQVVTNLIIGTSTVFVLWWLFGGRSFCSWACPYHLLSELAEKIHLKLRFNRTTSRHQMHRGVRTIMYIIFLALAYFTGYTVYEAVSPTGIVSRALIYGPSLALIWVVGLLIFEIFVARRAWCRYICPIGLTYGFVGSISPLVVEYNLETCVHEGECRKVCLVPHVLECVKKGYAHNVKVNIAADCTRCGMCIDACPTGSLKYKIRIIDDI